MDVENDQLAMLFIALVLIAAGCCPDQWLAPLLAVLTIWAVGTFCRNMERQQNARQADDADDDGDGDDKEDQEEPAQHPEPEGAEGAPVADTDAD